MKKAFLPLFLFNLFLNACFGEIGKKEGAAPPPQAAAALFSGTIDLAPELKSAADPLAVIFVMARTPEGSLAAAKKLLPPFQYPLKFELTAEDLMIPGMELPKEFQPSARLDVDSNANPPQAGDILGRAEPQRVPSGSQGVKIILQELVK